MKPPDDEVLLRDMLDHARLASAAARGRSRQDLEVDPVLAAAMERFIEVIGEAAGRVSEATRVTSPEIRWREIVGMRNRLVHGYASVDREIIWDVVSGDIPELITALEGLLGD